MDATYYTLDYDGAETDFRTLGFSEPRATIDSQGKRGFTVHVPADPPSLLLTDPPVPYFGKVIIRRYIDGDPTAAEIIFQGRQITDKRIASESPAGTLTFSDAWHDLANLVYQQEWSFQEENTGDGATGSHIVYSVPTSRVNLFQDYSGSLQFLVSAVYGSGYKVGDILTLSGGTLQTGATAPTMQITSINSSGGITSFNFSGSTSYSTYPTSPASATGGSGYGATFYVTPSAAGGPITAGQQVINILDWAIECGVDIQVGNIGLDWLLPIYPAKGIMCSAAIQICMKPFPDAVCWIDPTTVPPTFNVTRRASLTPLTVPYADGQTHKTGDVTPRYDLVVPEVVLQYHKPEDLNGFTVNTFASDVYPAGSLGKQVGALVVPLELGGSKLADQTGQVTAVEFSPWALDWWKIQKPELAGYLFGANPFAGNITVVVGVNTATITVATGGVTISDPAGILSAMPNQVYDQGSIQKWMPITWAKADVSAKMVYTETDAAGRNVNAANKNEGHEVTVQVELCSAGIGTATYFNVTTSEYGEAMIPGLPQYLWTALQPLSFEGQHSLYEESVSGYPQVGAVLGVTVGPEFALNITGGRSEWATMLAIIQSVAIDYTRGFTDITFGPPKHLAPGDLNELLQFWRYRWSPGNAQTRQSGMW